MMMLLIHTNEDTSIILCQGFSEKTILSLLSDQLRHIFDNLYQDSIMRRNKFGSSTVDETATIMLSTLLIHEVMADFSKHEIKHHPSITFKFVRFLIMAKIYEPLQDISQMNRETNVLRTKSDFHNSRSSNTEY